MFIWRKKFNYHIEVWDQDLVKDDRIGYCSVLVMSLLPGEHALPVKSLKGEQATGTITILDA